MTNTFTDLQPSETDATGIVGGAFLGFGPVVIPLPGGTAITLFGNVD